MSFCALAVKANMQRITSKDGTPIAFDRSGSGHPMVLVSGAATSRSVHAELATLLSSDFDVFNYDRRGRGDSGDTLPYAVEREIDDLASVVAATGGQAAVFGSSSGAVLALRAAAAGLPITRLALWEPPLMVDPDAAAQGEAYASQLNALLADDRRGDAMALFLSRVGVPEHVIGGMRSSPAWPAMEAIAHTLAYDAAVMGDNSVPPDLRTRFKARTLVLTGDKTGQWMEQAARALVSTIPSAEHRVLKDQTHAVDWHVLATELKQFFLR